MENRAKPGRRQRAALPIRFAHFAPSTAVTTNQYKYDYYFVFAPNSGTGYTTTKEPEQIIAACSLNLHTCPDIQVVDKYVGGAVVASSPSPAAAPTTVVGLNQVPTVQWKSGTGASGVTYSFYPSSAPAFYLSSSGGTAVKQYAVQSDYSSATPPPQEPYPVLTAAPSYFYFSEGGTIGPYTDTTIAVSGVALQGVISSSYTEVTAQNTVTGKYSVKTPTSVKLSAIYGNTQINSNTNSTQTLGLGWIDSNGTLQIPGITFSFNATVPNSNDLFAMIQLANACLIDTTASGTNSYYGQSNSELDSVHSSGSLFGNPATITKASAGAWSGKDGPRTYIAYKTANYVTVYEQDHFTDFFMYQPAPLQSRQSAIWVPIGQYTWFENATGTGASPNPFMYSSGSGGIQYAPQLTPPGAPTWSGVIQSNGTQPQSSKPTSCSCQHEGSLMTNRYSRFAVAIGFAFLSIGSPSNASVPASSLAADTDAPKAEAFALWGPNAAGLDAAIVGPSIGSLTSSEYFVAMRNVSPLPVYLCGIPWATLELTSRTGSPITPSDTPRRSVYSGFSDTIELRSNEEWVLPISMNLKTSYKTKPENVADANYELEVHVGARDFSSCNHAATVLVRSAPLRVTLTD